MVNYYGLKLENGETRLTDFNEGSEIRNILEAFAIGIYALLEEQHEATRIAFISSSYGIWLDRIGELPFIDLPRVTGDYAHGAVTFTLAVAQEADFVVPMDTIVASSELGIDFATTADCTISAGETSESVPVTCLVMGEDGNVPSGSIDSIIGGAFDSEILSVTNASAMEEGTDEENDEDYRERLLDNVQADGFGTQGWYVNLCKSVDGVHDVLLIDDTDETDPLYTKVVLVNGDEKPTPNGILVDVLTNLTDIDNIVINHRFNVDKPTYTEVNLNIGLSVVAELDEDMLEDTMQKLFDGGEASSEMTFDGLNINEALTADTITSTLEIFDGLVEVTSLKDGVTDVTTLTPATNGVLQLKTISITQTVV